MGKVVKKITRTAVKVAPYVAVAAGGYYAAGAMAGASTAAAGAAYTGSTSMMTTLAAPAATSGFGFSSLASGLTFGNVMSGVSTLTSVGGVAMQAQGNIQSQKYASQAADASRNQILEKNKSDAVRNRYNQLQYKRQRMAALRQARVSQGQIGGSMGGTLGAAGTSSYIGAIGSLATSTANNIGNINVAEGYGNTVSALNTSAANFGSQANTAGSKGTQWQNIATLGGNLFNQADGIANIFNKATT
jgi:hypothetical protein